MNRTDYEAVTLRGVTIRTFQTEELARVWVAAHKADFTGLHVEEVITTTTRRPVYRPRNLLRIVA